MTADEYLVEEIKRLKEDNNKLLQEKAEFFEERRKLMSSNDELPDYVVNINERLGEVYRISYMNSGEIEEEFKHARLTKFDLEKALSDNEYIFKSYDNFHSTFANSLFRIDVYTYNHILKSKHGNVYIYVYIDYKNKLKCDNLIIDNKEFFLDYQEAKKIGIELSRSEIKKVLYKL